MQQKTSDEGGDKPLVSVLVPIYNVEKFLNQCLDSLHKQTLGDVEFICINDGSTDDSLQIIRHFMTIDKRFKLLDKSNSGYGDSMNQGLAMANGKYVGIVESDDWAEPQMFSDLVELAECNQAQAVKSNFYFYNSSNGGASQKFDIVDPLEVGFVINPRQSPHIFRGMSTIWSGLYNRQFLLENEIDFVPSPGASYQDTAFNFKVWAAATRVVYTDEAYLHYRIDNDQSSVKSRGKVFCVCDEFESIKDYLIKHNLMSRLRAVYTQRKLDIYNWNLSRLHLDDQIDFAKKMQDDFNKDVKDGYFDSSQCSYSEIKLLNKIRKHPVSTMYSRAVKQNLGRVKNLASRYISKFRRARNRRLETLNVLNATLLQSAEEARRLTKSLSVCPSKYIDRNSSELPIVSVIVPIYNSASYLDNTLESLINQTLHDIEIICINDGSTDDSLKILKRYAKKDQRIKVFTQNNAGVAAARNKGLTKASGKYIMWCDSDDIYTPDMCLKMVSAMEYQRVDMAMCSQAVSYDKVGKKNKDDTESYLKKHRDGAGLIGSNNLPIVDIDVSLWNKIYRKDLIDKLDLSFPDGLLFEDSYFCTIYLMNSRTIYYIDQKLYNYNRRTGSIMSESFGEHEGSLDYLKITKLLYDYMKKSEQYEKYANVFWIRLIQSYSYAQSHLDKKGRLEAELLAREFIVKNFDEYAVLPKHLRKGVDRLLNHPRLDLWLFTVRQYLLKLVNKLSSRRCQMNSICKLSKDVLDQLKYNSYLVDQIINK